MSKIEVDEVVNQSGDNDSGIDLTTNDQIGFKIANASKWTLNSSGNLFPASTSQGIVLGATSDTSANRLDDYEEGTWTPTLSSGGSSTYDNAHGRYTKIGRFVACHFTLEIGDTFAGGTTAYLIGGLPFARANGTNDPSGSGFAHYFENISQNTNNLTFRVDSGQSVMYISGRGGDYSGLYVNHNVLQAQANVYGSVFYYTNT